MHLRKGAPDERTDRQTDGDARDHPLSLIPVQRHKDKSVLATFNLYHVDLKPPSCVLQRERIVRPILGDAIKVSASRRPAKPAKRQSRTRTKKVSADMELFPEALLNQRMKKRSQLIVTR